jgi:hypothetical protein
MIKQGSAEEVGVGGTGCNVSARSRWRHDCIFCCCCSSSWPSVAATERPMLNFFLLLRSDVHNAATTISSSSSSSTGTASSSASSSSSSSHSRHGLAPMTIVDAIEVCVRVVINKCESGSKKCRRSSLGSDGAFVLCHRGTAKRYSLYPADGTYAYQVQTATASHDLLRLPYVSLELDYAILSPPITTIFST